MGKRRNAIVLPIVLTGFFLLTGCGKDFDNNAVQTGRKPIIDPDYTDVTIPPNIAPLNFIISEPGDYFRVTATNANNFSITIKSSDGIIRFPEKAWRKLLNDSGAKPISVTVSAIPGKGKQPIHFLPFRFNVAEEPVDPYLAYRLIYPGYYNWSAIRIMQRSIGSFVEKEVVDNRILDMNCVNCHSFSQYDPEKFMVHIRGSHGATYILDKGSITKRDPKIDAMPGGATYPAWHPGGRFIAYSSNQVRQGFYAKRGKTIEVFDLVSDLIVFDIETNKVAMVREPDTTSHLLTFPSWSPDGQFLYYCRSERGVLSEDQALEQIGDTRYDLARIPFNQESMTFGTPEIVFNASALGKSASFPRISPDGRYLVFTLSDFGTFPIWHNEADLYLLDLETREYKEMNLNSGFTESYHSWSSNGRWLVFSSKRTDSRSTRPFLAYFSSPDSTGKPFILPQKDPRFYDNLMESFNIPEFVKGEIKINPHDFKAVADNKVMPATPSDPSDSLRIWEIHNVNVKRHPGERSIHE